MIVVVGMIQITYDIHTEREKGSKGREKKQGRKGEVKWLVQATISRLLARFFFECGLTYLQSRDVGTKQERVL